MMASAPAMTGGEVPAPIVEPRFPGWLAVLAFLLAFTLLGSRPLWDPDEGRYSNVALTMLESGDWVHPMRNHEEGHWTKPPLTYWAVASSVAVLGYHPFAARLPVALAYLAGVWLCWRIARRLAPGRESLAGLAFATMLLPMAAAQVLTTDFLLAAFEALAMWGYVEARFGDPTRARRWLLLMWFGFALAFLTKGPPALLPLLAIVLFNGASQREGRAPLWAWPGLLVFVAVGFSWFLVVVMGNPELLHYYLGEEVAERVVGHGFKRNSQWYGWALVYLPTLLLGSVPWTGRLWRWLRAAPGPLSAWWRGKRDDAQAAGTVFLALWLLVPLLVLCLAHSRLPLYVLPLFVPLALAVASVPGPPLARRWLAVPIVLVLALRVAAVFHPTHKNAADWADAIRDRVDFPVAEVVFVDDMARYGLHLHLRAEVEKVTLHPLPEPRPLSDENGHGLRQELLEQEPGVVYITKQAQFPEVTTVVEAAGFVATVHGPPLHERMIFTVQPQRDAGDL